MRGIASTFIPGAGWCFPHIKLKGYSPEISKTLLLKRHKNRDLWVWLKYICTPEELLILKQLSSLLLTDIKPIKISHK